MKILIVEPMLEMRRAIEQTFKGRLGENYEIVVTPTYTDGDSFIAEHHQDIAAVLVAYGGAMANGGEFAERVKRLYPAIKVVLLSTDSDVALIAHNLGLDDFLEKGELARPVVFQEFVTSLGL